MGSSFCDLFDAYTDKKCHADGQHQKKVILLKAKVAFISPKIWGRTLMLACASNQTFTVFI